MAFSGKFGLNLPVETHTILKNQSPWHPPISPRISQDVIRNPHSSNHGLTLKPKKEVIIVAYKRLLR
jgi:hypothetical protein